MHSNASTTMALVTYEYIWYTQNDRQTFMLSKVKMTNLATFRSPHTSPSSVAVAEATPRRQVRSRNASYRRGKNE